MISNKYISAALSATATLALMSAALGSTQTSLTSLTSVANEVQVQSNPIKTPEDDFPPLPKLSPEQRADLLKAMSKTKRYQAAVNINQQTNSTLAIIQNISAIADALAEGSGTYAEINSDKIASLMPNEQSFISPWGSEITISNQTPISYTVTISKMPRLVCLGVLARLKGHGRFSMSNQCSSLDTDDFVYIYTNKPPQE